MRCIAIVYGESRVLLQEKSMFVIKTPFDRNPTFWQNTCYKKQTGILYVTYSVTTQDWDTGIDRR